MNRARMPKVLSASGLRFFPAGSVHFGALQQNFVAVCLILLFVALDSLSIRHKTITYDEPFHWQYGRNILEGNSNRFSDSKVPASALNAIPSKAASQLTDGPIRDFLRSLGAARGVTIFFSGLLGWLVFIWSRRLYGFLGGFLSLFLYAFCPNLQAHSRWVTTDLYAAAASTAFLYVFWRLCQEGGWGKCSVAAIALGLAPLAKPTLILLYPIVVLLLVLRFGGKIWGECRRRDWKPVKAGLGRFALGALLFLAASIAAINAGYLFSGFGEQLKNYRFRSAEFESLQKTPFVSELPVPFPRPFLEGVDWVRYNETTGVNRGPAYLMGEVRNGRFFWYYPIVVLFKVPLAIQLMILLALATCFANFRTQFSVNEFFLLVPALAILFYVAFVSGAQLGIRLLLPALPLLYVFCGALLRKGVKSSRSWLGTICLLCVWLAVSSLSYFPHYLSYFNELAGSPTRFYRILADSNLDWGQNEWYIDQYQERHPYAAKNALEPFEGRVAMSANLLAGILYPGGDLSKPFSERRDPWTQPEAAWPLWVGKHLNPVDHVAYSYLIFDVRKEDLEEFARR